MGQALADMQPLSFLQLMRKTPVLQRLMGVIGLQTCTEGRNVTDIMTVYMSQDLGWSWTAVNNAIAAVGVGLVGSGYAVKSLLGSLGLRRFTSMSNLANYMALILWANAPPFRFMFSESFNFTLGLIAMAPGSRKRDAVEALILRLGKKEGFGNGFVSGSLMNWRALQNVMFPVIWGTVYRRGRLSKRPSLVWFLASFSVIIAECLMGSISNKDLGLGDDGHPLADA